MNVHTGKKGILKSSDKSIKQKDKCFDENSNSSIRIDPSFEAYLKKSLKDAEGSYKDKMNDAVNSLYSEFKKIQLDEKNFRLRKTFSNG